MTTLYVIPLSHPARAAQAMVAYKGLAHRLVSFPPGFHSLLVRAAGFGRRTVPALELDGGQRIQGSMAIARVLDDLIQERPLFPGDAATRRAVEAAERWGHDVFQPGPRRVFRWALANDPALRHWMAEEIMHAPAPRLLALAGGLISGRMVALSGASEEKVREDIRAIPGLLDHVDELVASGVIGTDSPNAADFQILSGVRVTLEFTSLAHLVEERTCAAAARRLFPRWEGPVPPTPLPRV